ncbi:uncharacterized protein (TIGR02145 family) [Parabacteroides sp. PFB2-10]|uniref:Ig-like domain-containing protein n=1 Tax=Parabacteroides sp. PFB2-10 TaxID=1742405 RepID=UPI002475389B|nr:Ig-like domain-containing protein [Parabacteroides sp. PFB2-10]MDH6312414.1 uncharacterized protein (TIGR02145 family) [Parabacteroides sp. PFB2-10]
MKKVFLFLSVAALLLSGCGDDEVRVGSVTVTATSTEFIVGNALPTLTAVVTPDDADNKTVTWSSNKPEILAVDVETGVLELKVTDLEESEEVKITAMADGQSDDVTITVKGLISYYEILDFSSEFGLLVLDRNVGATAAYDKGAADNTAANGNFYQLGRNVVVATGATEAANAEFDANWTAESAGYVDWSVPANTPCPKGWGVPNQTQFVAMMKLLENYNIDLVDFDMITKEEYDAAKAANAKMKLAKSGYFREASKKYLPGAEAFWSAAYHTSGAPWGYVHNLFPNKSRETAKVAMPIRCVKAAP